jgi:hypothetical protein
MESLQAALLVERKLAKKGWAGGRGRFVGR